MSWGFRNKWTAQKSAALVRQQPPSQFVQPATAIVSRSFIIKVPDAGIPGLTLNTDPTLDKPGEAECEAYLRNADGDLEKIVTQPGAGEFKITCINLSQQTIEPDKDDQDQPVATYLPVIQLGTVYLVLAVSATPATEEITVLTNLKAGSNGQLCAETKTIDAINPVDAADICVDLCDVVRCCDWQYSLPDDCVTVLCNDCEFPEAPFGSLTIEVQDDPRPTYNGTYTGKVDQAVHEGGCIWNMPYTDSQGQDGTSNVSVAWTIGKIWQVSLNHWTAEHGSLSISCRGPVTTCDAGSNVLYSEHDPGHSGFISWTGWNAPALGTMGAVEFLQHLSRCRADDVQALIGAWGKDRAQQEIERLVELMYQGSAAKRGNVNMEGIRAAIEKAIREHG